MKIQVVISFLLAFLVGGVVLIINNSSDTSKIANGVPYNLNTPDDTHYLPQELREISGLSYFDKNKVLGIQDEDGLLFIYDLDKKRIEEKIKFAHDADYEGIEMVKNSIYILRSDGTLYKVKNFFNGKPDKKKFKTHLSSKNDTEGLAFDDINKRLLILCKEHPGKGFKGKRAVYSFDLDKKELSKKPAILLDKSIILKMTDNLSSEFKPSALAIHPISNDIYIIDSAGKILVVLSNENEIKSVSVLPKRLYPQPEGITFTPNGDLLISNEGAGGKGNILYFKYLK